MADDNKVTVFRVAQFVVGAVFLGVMLYIHAYVKELPVWFMALPFTLLGIDPTKFIGGGKK